MTLQGVCSSLSRAPAHPDLHVERHWGVVRPRRMVRVSGVSPPVDLRGFNNSIDTLERAVLERVFYVKQHGEFVPPPRPERGHFTRALSGTRARLVPLLPLAAPMSYDSFVATFRGRKRKVYQAAVESLLRSSVSKRDAALKVFVKYEKTDFTRKADPVPRVISPRDPRFNVEVGRFLRPIEERIFDAISALYGHKTVFKGMNALESGRCLAEKWAMFRRPVAVGLDASRFDQHVSIDALRWEHAIYRECFPCGRDRRRLDRLLRWQLRNRCVGHTVDGRLRYTIAGGRMSGDMNTSLGNCVLMCSMIHAYAAHRGVRVQLANNGDDCVVVMEAGDLARFSEGLDDWFVAMGFSMVVEQPCYDLERVEFCQTQPVWVGPQPSDYLMVRHPKWAIAKDTVSVHPLDTDKLFRGWLDAVGQGGLAMTGGVPVFQDFYASYVRNGRFLKSMVSGQSWGVRALSRGMRRTYGAVSPQTRCSFWVAFGVTPDEQLCLERFYSSLVVGGPCSVLAYQPQMPL